MSNVGQLKKVAVITMVYNEPFFLPYWKKYYGNIFGSKNCFIIDHGSDDGSLDYSDDFSVLRIPRSPMDDAKRARFISNLATSLFEWFDIVIYTDVDEILVADPNKYSNLHYFCSKLEDFPYVNAIGFNLYHLDDQKPIDFQKPILSQRPIVRFALPMCKPLIVFSKPNWTPGFHSILNSPPYFSDLYLFHLHHIDLDLALTKLIKTRSMDWSNLSAGAHQRVEDQEYISMILDIRKLTVDYSTDESFYSYLAEIKEKINQYCSTADNINNFYYKMPQMNNLLLHLPESWVNIF